MFFDANNNNVKGEEDEFVDVEGDDYSPLLPPKKRISRHPTSSFHRPWTSPSVVSLPSPASSTASLTPTKPNHLALKSDYTELLLSQLSPNTAMAAATLMSFPMLFPPSTNDHRVDASTLLMTPSSMMSTSPSSPVSSEADSGYHEMGLTHLEQPLDLSFRRPSTPLPTSTSLLNVHQHQHQHQSYRFPMQPAGLLMKQPKHEEEKEHCTGIKRPLPSMSSTSLASSAILKPDASAKLVCPTCGKHYGSTSRFRAHCRRHYAKKTQRYQCNKCLKCFVQRSSLRTHERIHTGERPYHCGVCDERFGDFSTYTKHRRIHTGEKPYGCPVCNRCFSQSGNMHRHLKVVHKEEAEKLSLLSVSVPTSSALLAPFLGLN